MKSPHAGAWALDLSVAYLNHGSYGACPREVLAFQAALREEMEREAVDFMNRRLPSRLAEARAAVGSFMGADPDGLVFVHNATTGVNAALRSWELKPGDEVLTTDHAYMACHKAAAHIVGRRGARLVTAKVPFPVSGPGEIEDAVMAGVTSRTKVALLDHVSSPTALIWPVEKLVAALLERGVETIVDGAHALGMLPLAVDSLGAACYTANAHKWACAPKGAAVLWVRSDLRCRVRPLVVSHGYDPAHGALRFREEWDWLGTDDPTPWLSIPESLRVMGAMLPDGWAGLMRRNHDLAVRGRRIVLDALGLPPPCPDEMLGSMASIPMPAGAAGSPAARLDADMLAAWTRARGIESWFADWPDGGVKMVRVSAQLYNDEDQYRALAALLKDALREG